MTAKYTSILLFFFIFSTALFSQSNENRIYDFSGRLLSNDDTTGIAFAHVINLKNGQVAVSDTMGYFWLPVMKKDSILITSIGFHNHIFTLNDSIINTNDNALYVKIFLPRRDYRLAPVDVLGISWKEFKYQVTNMDLTDEEKVYEKNVRMEPFTEEELAQFRAMQPAGITINLKSRQDRQRELLDEIKREKQREEKYHRRLNTLIGRYTGLEGKKLLDFIDFCNFDRDFVLNSTEYMILVEVKRYYRYYKKVLHR